MGDLPDEPTTIIKNQRFTKKAVEEKTPRPLNYLILYNKLNQKLDQMTNPGNKMAGKAEERYTRKIINYI